MIRIYGASDDLVEIEGHPDGDEVSCYECAVVITIGDRAGGCVVRMDYGPKWHKGAVWSAAIAPIDDGVPIPWAITVELEPEKKYSPVVLIDAPATAALSWKSLRRKP